MRHFKLFTREKFKLLLLIFCLAASVPQLRADVVVAGNNTTLFGGSWTTATNSSNKMTQHSGTNYYYLTKTNANLTGNLEFKVVDNGNWYGTSNGNNVTCNATGTHTITFLYNSSNHEVDRIGTFSTDVIVTGSDAQALGSSWANSNLSNAMSTSDGLTFTLTRTAQYTSATSMQFKVHSVTTDRWYGTSSGGNVYYSIPGAGTYDVTYTFNVISREVSATVTPTSVTPPTPDYYIIGGNTDLWPNGWNTSNIPASQQMTESNGVYTWSASNVHLDAGSIGFKVYDSNGVYHPSGSGTNININVSQSGTYDLVITYDPNSADDRATVVLTPISLDPVIPHYYVTGDNGLGLGGFTCVPTLELTDADGDGIFTYTTTATADGTYSFVFANGKGANSSDWSNFNDNYRIGPTNGNTQIAINAPFQQTQLSGGDHGAYQITVAAGPVTFYINHSDMTFRIEATELTIPVNYYVKGDNTDIFPNGWNDGASTAMTDNGDGTYTWTSGQFRLEIGTSYAYKVWGDDNSWHPNGDNATFSSNVPGTYTVTITYDNNNETVNAVLNPIQTDPLNTYNIYVRYTGQEPIQNVFIYAWDTGGDLSDAWSGSTGGTSLSSLTTQEINGYTYYKVSYTSYATSIGVIFNENGSGDTKTADLTANPGDNYFTYGGGSDVVGPSSQADVPDYFVVGQDTSLFPNGWNTGSETLMTDNNGTYTLTLNNVQLNANQNYEYKVRGTDGSWYPDGDNASFSVDARGTYNVVFTFDGTNVNAVATLVQADPTYDYDIYVRYTGNENVSNVFVYAWDNEGTLSDAWDGSTGGTALSSLTSQEINGHTYYHVTYTSYDSSISLIFNENGSSSTQTADLTAEPGDSYFTYGGGSTVDGPNAEADEAITSMYLIGYAGTQQWAANAGIEMEWDEANGYYKLTNVVLTAGSQFAFATQLGSTNDDWETLNNHRLSSNGANNWLITDDMFDTWLNYRDYTDENHNWYVNHAGSYDIFVNPATRMVMVSAPHEEMYISYGVNWTYQDNSMQMSTVDGNIYQATITFNNGDYFLFSTNLTDETAWGAETNGYEITDMRIGYAQKMVQGSANNYHFTGTSGKYIVVVNKEKKTVTLRKTTDATVTKVYLQKSPNVVLDPAGGTYNNVPVEGKRGGIYAWNKLNLEAQNGQTYTWAMDKGPTNYTYAGEVGNDYGGDNYLKDMNDTITADGKQWYAWSIRNSICEFYFIRNNKDDHKSQNVMRRAGEVWFVWTDEDATSNRQDDAVQCDSLQEVTRDYYDVSAGSVGDCATMLEGHYYVYYTNTTGWDSVYCYAWSENPLVEFNGTYPGSKCTFVGYDEHGYEVWCYDFGLIDQHGDNAPEHVIFDNGMNTDETRQQTGDMVYDNGACYDYLGMIYLGNSLNAIINSGVVNGPKYTVEDDLIGVYYDENAITLIKAFDESGTEVDYYVRGALYAKDNENYSAKSKMAGGSTDYVYDICAHPKTTQYPGGSQIQLKRTYYDQSNWVKIVLSPNFDNTNAKSNGDVTIDADQFDTMNYEQATAVEGGYLSRYVGKIIPGHSMSGNLVNNVNPQMHITNIANPVAANQQYEKNVYVTTNFNDSVVFSYAHQDWKPGNYQGVYRTVPYLGTDDQGNTIIDHTEVDESVLYKMYYVAPKPQEVAYITWAVFDHPNPNNNIGTPSCVQEPDEPGAFYAPMNWDRTGQLWDGTDPNDPNAPWGTTYGPFSNGYMQYGAFQVNWSLFEDMEIPVSNTNREQLPWYQVFKPGQAYKILAIIRYAHGDKPEDVEYTPGVYSGNGYNEGAGSHVANAPRRSNTRWADIKPVEYDDLDQSKFIVFPLRGSSEDSNGNDIGNVTVVKEVSTARTVVSERYYNLTGVESDKPFSGINIVVTTYNDGSRTSKKILR